MSEETIAVEVAYARPERQLIVQVTGPPGLTLQQAIERSRIVEQFPEIDPASAKVGIFGKVAKKDAVLQDGDRVEIYRPLIADPKETRKKRAAQGKPMKKGGASKT